MFLFESERLRFREHQPSDMEAYCALEADPEVRRYVGGAPRPHEVAARKFRNTFLKNASRELALRATIFKPEGRYIGYSGLYPNFRPGGLVPGEAVLAFCFAREYWGRGLATEAGRAFVNFAAPELKSGMSARIWIWRCGFRRSTAWARCSARGIWRCEARMRAEPDQASPITRLTCF